MQRKKKTARSQPAEPSMEPALRPQVVLRDFCKDYHLHEVKQMLWEWLTTALSKQHTVYDTGRERSNLIFFYEKINALVVAVYQLQPTNAASSKKPKIISNHKSKKHM